MNTQLQIQTKNPYSRAIAASKRARWDLDGDVLRGRSLDPTHKCLPDALSLAHELTFLDDGYIDYFGRPWAQNWEKHFEQGWQRPEK